MPRKEQGLEREAESERMRRQRDFLRQQDKIIKGIQDSIRDLTRILDAASVAREIVASGQSHSAALFLEWKILWCRATGEAEFDGNPARVMKVLRARIRYEEKRKSTAAAVRKKIQVYFKRTDDWTRRQNWSAELFDKEYTQLGAQKTGEPEEWF